MPTIETPGAIINFEVIGDEGSWVTLINGHTRSSNDFRMMARIFSEAGLRVLSLDNRGAGKSQVSRPFTITDMCEDVVALWDHLEIAKSSLLGISMGGFISQGIAIQSPSRVSKLVLVSTAPEDRFIHPTGGGWISEGSQLEEKMRSYFAPGFVDRNPVLFKTMVSQIRQSIESGKFTNLSNMQRDALRGASWTQSLASIQCETCIIHGSMDLVIDLAGAQLLKSSIRNSQIKIIPSAGHLLLAEAPKELYALALEFLLK